MLFRLKPFCNDVFKLIVECDGYGYHSNKTSFSQDRTRDRLLHIKGFQVMRFSGSDIVANPTGTSKELSKYLIDQKPKL
ncbi:MAG: endonuclease domain-containing protein [Ktedonobacteraceae bacterium]